MASLAARTLIEAPPERVWEIVADLEGQQHWMADVRSLEIIGARKSGPGTVLKVTSELFGLPVIKDVMEITAWDPPREFGVRHRGQFAGTGSFRLESRDGGTLFIWREDFKPPLGSLGEIAHSLLIRPHLQRVFRRSLANLKWIAERT